MTLPATLLRRLSADDQVKLDLAAARVEVATFVRFDALQIGYRQFEPTRGSSRRQLATQALYEQHVVVATGLFRQREALLARRGDDYALYVQGTDKQVWTARFSARLEE